MVLEGRDSQWLRDEESATGPWMGRLCRMRHHREWDALVPRPLYCDPKEKNPRDGTQTLYRLRPQRGLPAVSPMAQAPDTPAGWGSCILMQNLPLQKAPAYRGRDTVDRGALLCYKLTKNTVCTRERLVTFSGSHKRYAESHLPGYTHIGTNVMVQI